MNKLTCTILIFTSLLIIYLSIQSVKSASCPSLTTLSITSVCKSQANGFPIRAKSVGGSRRSSKNNWCCFIQKYEYKSGGRKRIGYCVVGIHINTSQHRAKFTTSSSRAKCNW
ncbi:hypothetical protein ABK040_000765 [Willaertia magna]